MEKLKVVSFFAGVGGIDLGFEKAGFHVVWANEIDKDASKTYSLNFNNKLLVGDIHGIEPCDVPEADVFAGGFPCQAFSVAGYRKGFEDERGGLFFEIYRLISVKKPRVVFLENVKNLIGHNHGKTLETMIEHLKSSGYHMKYAVLNACEFGNLPQNRERIYMVGFLDKGAGERFEFPQPVQLTKRLDEFIDFGQKQPDRYYYENRPIYPQLKEAMTSSDTVYQWRRVYVRENKSNLCPTLTANMGTGGHNVPLIKTETGIRKLTPRECFNLMGFDRTFVLPTLMADSHLYKQAGNSVAVPVIEKIAEKIVEAL